MTNKLHKKENNEKINLNNLNQEVTEQEEAFFDKINMILESKY